MGRFTSKTEVDEELGLEVIEEVLASTETFTKFWDGSTMKGSPVGCELQIKAIREHGITEMFQVSVDDYRDHLGGRTVLRSAIQRIWVAGPFRSGHEDQPNVATFVRESFVMGADGKPIAATKADAMTMLIQWLNRLAETE